MRLLFFIGSMNGGGAERVMSILCNKLVDRGHSVYLATNIEVPSVYSLDSRIKLVPWKIPAIGYKFIRLYKHARNVRRIAKCINPDCVISFMYDTSLLCILGLINTKIPVIASEHSPFPKKRVSSLEKVFRYSVYKYAAKVTVLTDDDYSYLKEKLSNLVVLANPCSFGAVESIGNRKKQVIVVGGLHRWKIKGFDTIIEVWGKIAKRHSDWKLCIVGVDDDKLSLKFLQDLIERNEVVDSVSFLGFQPHVDSIMKESPIFVLSSRFEGLPMVLIEAMSQGCACVSFDCKNGPAKILTNGVSGILVPDQDIVQMESVLDDLMTDSKLRMRISTGGLRESKRFDAEVIINKWEQLINDVLVKDGE